MTKKPANTPKPVKPASSVEKEAAKASTKGGQKITRETTNTRQEVRDQTHHQQDR